MSSPPNQQLPYRSRQTSGKSPTTPTSSQSGARNSSPMSLSNILNDDTPSSNEDTPPSSREPTPPTPNTVPSPRRREEPREEYDPEEQFLIYYEWLVLRRSWGEVERLFQRLFPPGYPRRIPLDNSPNWVQRSQDGLTSKGYRMRDAGGWGMQRRPKHEPETEKRLVYTELMRRWQIREVTPEFIRLLQEEEPRYNEFPMD